MTTSTRLLDFQFPAQADQLCMVRQKLRDTLEPLGKSEALVNCIVLAVGEACMNIIQHAYRQDENGDIILEVLKNGDDVTFRLTDFASHKTRADEMKSRPLDEIRPGGLGCHLINEIMDEVKLLDCNCGNVLQMKKCLSKK
ncbi:MAG: ATP-binding protein [Pseudomonadota bacterium]|nr:ATP-binding protein [Pseudomonadota bacterium]